MPAKDFYHEVVKEALIKEGWTITHDPLRLPIGKTKVYIDLGAEKLLGAERDGEKIAIEIKSFVGLSNIADLELALGQFLLYEFILEIGRPSTKTLSCIIRNDLQ